MEIDTRKGIDVVLRTEMRPELFASVFGAMLTNSVQWKHARRPLRITVSLRSSENHIEVLFADNGHGVKAGLERTLFSPMISGRDDGNGMGLTVARRIIENHGGTLEFLIDRRKKGATFRFVMPRKKARATL